MMQQQLVKVGMADLNIASGGAVLKTTGLGSCVGLALFDEQNHIAGLAHVMLPTSGIARDSTFNIAKYADTAIPDLIGKMVEAGANQKKMIAKMAGGAQMFAFSAQSDAMRIGPRNVESCKQILSLYEIPVFGEDTGGSYGRTVEFDSLSGVLVIRSVQFGVKEI
ncbi:chemotaxis protein CheD [Paenibacillus sp. GCM10027626]|uniref:chemotaxis protein CheD n=1 Tax=Paenibacillus sp. GCM10027626 TaxID=3273411 RepID=UPI00363BBF04